MSKYIESSLTPGEHIVHAAKLSVWPYSVAILLGIVLLPVFGIGLIIFLIIWIKFISTELAVTNKRIMVKTGFISRQTIELNLSRLETIQVHQSIFGRIFDYGTIVISGAGNPQAPIKSIRSPLTFRRAALDAQETISSGTHPQSAV